MFHPRNAQCERAHKKQIRIRQQPLWPREHPRPHGIQMRVIARRLQITAAAALDEQRFVAATKHMAK